MSTRGVIVALSGLVCAGKSTFARMAVEHCAAFHISVRDFLIHEAEQSSCTFNRLDFDEFAANYWREHRREDVYSKIWSGTNGEELIVIDGVRTPLAAEWFSSVPRYQYEGVLIKASLEHRIERLTQRGGEQDLSVAQLAEYDTKLLEGGLSAVFSNYVARTVNNDGTLLEFRLQMERVIAQIKKR